MTGNEANVPCSGGSNGEPEEIQIGGGLYNYGNAVVGSSIIAQNVIHRNKSNVLYSPDCATDYPGYAEGKLISAGGNVWGALNDSCGLFYPNGLAFDDCKPAQVGVADCFLLNDIPILREK